MKRIRRPGQGSLIGLACALALIAGCARTARETASDDVLRDIFHASVQIGVERNGAPFRWGSGVVIGTRPSMAGTECLVLTAGHTLDRLRAGDEVFALLDRHRAESVKVPAQVILAQDSPSWDLALLKIASAHCVAARMGQPPSLGDSIWVVGFPLGGDMTVARGIVSRMSPTKPGTPFTIDASTSHGSSGAGVFESRTGRLVGLVESFGTARVSLQGDVHIDIPVPGMTYVTPVATIDDFLRIAGAGRLLVGRQ